MKVSLGLCLLAASALAVANALPSVGGADLQDKELSDLLKRLQADLEAAEKNSEAHVSRQVGEEGPGGDEPDTEIPMVAAPAPDCTSETMVDPAYYTRALEYVIDLYDKLFSLDSALARLQQSYGPATDNVTSAELGRRNRPQQVIVRREVLDTLSEMEYDLMGLYLSPLQYLSGEKRSKVSRLPHSPVASSAKAVGGKPATDVGSTGELSGKAPTKESHRDEAKALMQQQLRQLKNIVH